MKLQIRAPKEPEAKAEGRLVALPVKLCEPHPDLRTRLKYDQVDKLAKDIKVHGLLQPGRAVENPDGTGYWIYMGIGRLLAIKKLFEEFGEPKSYFAQLDEGLSFIDLFSRSMSENLKRRNLSLLEQERTYYQASLKANDSEIMQASGEIGEDPSMVRKKIELARALGERFGRLYEIEGKEGFSFQLGHLETLAKVTDERGFYLAAASTAFARFKVHELQASLRNRSLERVALGLPGWFGELFPEYAIERGEERKVVAQAAEASAREAEGTAGGRSPPASRGDGPHPFAGKAAPSTGPNASSGQHPPVGVPYKDSLLFAECPYCGAYTPFEFGDRSELTVIMFDGQAVPTMDTVAPEGSFRRVRACVNPECEKEFWLWVAEVVGEPRAETW